MHGRAALGRLDVRSRPAPPRAESCKARLGVLTCRLSGDACVLFDAAVALGVKAYG